MRTWTNFWRMSLSRAGCAAAERSFTVGRPPGGAEVVRCLVLRDRRDLRLVSPRPILYWLSLRSEAISCARRQTDGHRCTAKSAAGGVCEHKHAILPPC